jgi:hypothetical protein
MEERRVPNLPKVTFTDKLHHNRQRVRVRVLNIIFNNISVILWLSVLFIGGGNQSTLGKSSTCH